MVANQLRDGTGGVHLFFPEPDDADSSPATGTSQQSLAQFELELDGLTDAEQEVYRAVELRGQGPRSYARQTGRSPGTVGNLLGRAREKIGGGDGR